MTPPLPTDWDAVARARLGNVLGAERGRQVLEAGLAELGLGTIGTALDLYRLGQSLQACGGFEAAVGGMLSLHAVIHGKVARGVSSRP